MDGPVPTPRRAESALVGGYQAEMLAVTARVITTFDDPAVRPDIWSRLLAEGDTDVVSLTWQSQRLWWEEKERPEPLCLILAERDGEPKAIAPLFAKGGVAMNLHPATWLDLVGDISDPEILDAMLLTAQREVPEFKGIRFHFVPHSSRTAEYLRQAAGRLGFECSLEEEWPSPYIDIRGKPEAAVACTRKKTMLRRENQLRREGALAVHHFRSAEEVLPQLDAFFEQHISRWAETPTPSRYRDAKRRESYTVATRMLADAGCLRFSRLDLNGKPIAFHRGTCYRGHFKYSRNTFAIELAHCSPGTVLLRHLILAALEEGAHTFDFGLGAESYKYRYATDEIRLQTWGLYRRA